MFGLVSVFLGALAMASFVDLGITKSVQKRSAEPDSANMTLREFCVEQVGIAEDLVKEIEEKEDKEPTEEYFCYMFCVLTTGGIIDEEGTLNVDRFVENVDDEVDVDCLKTLPKFTECTDLTELDKCEDFKQEKKSK